MSNKGELWVLGRNADTTNTTGNNQWVPTGSSSEQVDSADAQVVVPGSCTVTKFMVRVTAQNADTEDLDVDLSTSDGIVRLTFGAGETGTKSTTTSRSLVEGDRMSIETVALNWDVGEDYYLDSWGILLQFD